MGNNLDLCKMINAPMELKCPRCRRNVETMFDDYDIDCGEPNPKPGVWVLDVYCNECDKEFEHKIKINTSTKQARNPEECEYHGMTNPTNELSFDCYLATAFLSKCCCPCAAWKKKGGK